MHTKALTMVVFAAASSTWADDFSPAKVAFAFADFSWAPGNRSTTTALVRPLTGELRVDTVYHHGFANPVNHTISGSSEVLRSGEFQLTQLGVGGDFYYRGVHARLMTQFGLLDDHAAKRRGRPAKWRLDDAYRYVSEAYGGYHFDVLPGLNVQASMSCRTWGSGVITTSTTGHTNPRRLFEYAVVLQWRARAALHLGQAENRAVAGERLAGVRKVQRRAWVRAAGAVAAHALVLVHRQSVRRHRHARKSGSANECTQTTA